MRFFQLLSLIFFVFIVLQQSLLSGYYDLNTRALNALSKCANISPEVK